MPQLKDLEELIGEVENANIADYLYEAYRCYGAGAYRATIVITNIALFDGLFIKLKALAPVSKVCKEIVKEIEPLQESQKVFELPLVHKLKAKKIITEFESQRLEQLISHRNKAAHPSGHHPSAEEARFVFTEAVSNFLAKPVRQTAYIVDEIVAKLDGDNFFPTAIITDTKNIVQNEVENLDNLAYPFLLKELNDKIELGNAREQSNSKKFLRGLAALKKPEIRKLFAKSVVVPRLSSSDEAKFITELCTCDPAIISVLKTSELLQLDALLVHNAKSVGVDGKTSLLMSPTKLAYRILKLEGEERFADIPDFREYLVLRAPLSEEFLKALDCNPKIKGEMLDRYIEIAGSSQFDTANRFAKRLSDLDEVIAENFSPKFSFQIITRVVKAADTGAFSAIGVADSGFAACPDMQTAALQFSKKHLQAARKILQDNGVAKKMADFRKEYLGN